MAIQDSVCYFNATASGLVKTGSGAIAGIVINSHTSGTIQILDGVTDSVAADKVITGTYTLPSGSQVIRFDQPISFTDGLYIVKGGTINYTVLYY